MKIKKISIKVLPVMLCYVSAIFPSLISGTVTKYLMYAFIITTDGLIFITEKKSHRILNNNPYIIVAALIVLIITIFAEIIGWGYQSRLGDSAYIFAVML